ncbi:uncharacterized protein LOC141628715 [Silene latifolia]|uniref:uncharacterized protein LOC141628715 n=1 Tax=Silene latifolia TaxID=37657 RepID=UPI003D786FDC
MKMPSSLCLFEVVEGLERFGGAGYPELLKPISQVLKCEYVVHGEIATQAEVHLLWNRVRDASIILLAYLFKLCQDIFPLNVLLVKSCIDLDGICILNKIYFPEHLDKHKFSEGCFMCF